MKINYRIKIEHNYHNTGRCRIFIYNLITMKVESVRYIGDTTEIIQNMIDFYKELIEYKWGGQVVQILES